MGFLNLIIFGFVTYGLFTNTLLTIIFLAGWFALLFILCFFQVIEERITLFFKNRRIKRFKDEDSARN
jgi:uncharacterized membrane protein YciS (DUF1049 family)